MKPSTQTSPSRGGFSLTDLLVAIATVLILAAIATSFMTRARERAALVRCTANLHAVSKATLDYAANNNQTLPAASAYGDVWWFYKEDVKSYAGLKGESSEKDTLFACPNDRGYTDSQPFWRNPRFDFNSYNFNGVTLPGVPNIAGMRLFDIRDTKKTLLVMEFAAHGPLAWHYSKTGKRNAPFYRDASSVVGFVDGHVSFTKIYYDGFNAAYTRDPIPGYDYQYSGN